jgi:porin-like protein
MVVARLQKQPRHAVLACAVVAVAVLVPKVALSADAVCCSDLEARIAQLESTVVGKGNRKVNVEIAGAVSRAVLSWDDGQNADSYIVTNDGEGSKIEITGEAEHFNRANWSAGFHIEINVQGAGSGDVNQFDDNIPRELKIDESQIWLRHRKFGQLTWGFVGGTGENAEDLTEDDLSDTTTAGYSGVEDVGGGFFLRRSNVRGVPGLLPVVWGDLIDHLPGIDGTIARYDTPFYRGFEANATYGMDDEWQLALNWVSEPEENAEENPELAEAEPMEENSGAFPAQTGLLKIFHISGTVGLFDIRDVPTDQAEAEANLLATGTASEPNNRTVAGSLSVLHKPSGISLTGAAARRKFTSSVRFNDDEVGRPNDSWFYYFKLGWQRNLNRLGKTAFYAEYGSFNQFLGRDADEEAVSALAGIDEDAVCASARSACLVSDSNATIWGLGVVQFVKSAEMQIYTAYRHYEPDIDLSTRRGAGVGAVPLDSFQTIMTGALIDF